MEEIMTKIGRGMNQFDIFLGFLKKFFLIATDLVSTMSHISQHGVQVADLWTLTTQTRITVSSTMRE